MKELDKGFRRYMAVGLCYLFFFRIYYYFYIRMNVLFCKNKKCKKTVRRLLEQDFFSGFVIRKKTKCLMIAPHPDDEVIGCGGVLCKYASNFDVICLSSSGIAYHNLSAENRADIRISEFEKVMKYLNVNFFKIYKTYGKPPLFNKMKSFYGKYLQDICFQKYDYIFLPHPQDKHKEHQFVSNILIPALIASGRFSFKTKIVFYEVWSPMASPSYYEDISDVIDEKKRLIGMYSSQLVKIDYVSRISALNHYRGIAVDNVAYAEAYKVVPLISYLRGVK